MRNEQVAVDDVTYTLAASAAEDAVTNFCGRSFTIAGASTARSIIPHMSSTLLLIYDCVSVATVVEAGSSLAATSYQLEPINGLDQDGTVTPYTRIRKLYQVPWFNRYDEATIVVTAAWGWATVPTSVKMATLIIGKDILKQRDVNSGVAGFSDFGAVRVRTNPIAKELLQSYVRGDSMGVG